MSTRSAHTSPYRIRLLGCAALLAIVCFGARADAAGSPAQSCTWGTFSSNTVPGGCWRPYSNSSPFNRAQPNRMRWIRRGGAIGRRTASFGAGAPVFYGGVAETGDDFGHPLYYSRASDPLYRVDCVKPWGRCDVEGASVRIPAAARAAAGDDGHMAVIDQASGTEYDFWQVRSKPSGGGTLTVSWGGRTAIGTPSSHGLGGKAVAAHYGLAAGVIRPEELRAGRIDHALFMTVSCTSGRSVWPAGSGTGKVCEKRRNAPAMGAHFYLRMSNAQIAALSVPAWQKTILRAMREYGMFVGDTGASHNGWALKVASGASYTSMGYSDPWVTLGQDLGVPTHRTGSGATRYAFDLRRAVNWRKELRVANPCVARQSC